MKKTSVAIQSNTSTGISRTAAPRISPARNEITRAIFSRLRHYCLPSIAIVLFLLFVYNQHVLVSVMQFLFPNAVAYTYDRVSLADMFIAHAQIVVLSSIGASLTGIILGIAVTRPWGRQFLPLAQSAVSLIQTMPPVAVLALITPILGFGATPTIVALYAFSILPVLNNTISGILSVSENFKDVARGMGMSHTQRLFKVELPLAARIISAGVRVSTVINIGTATIGAVIGAGGFGVIIIAGLVRNNHAFILSGAIATSLFALLVNWGLKQIEERFYRSRA